MSRCRITSAASLPWSSATAGRPTPAICRGVADDDEVLSLLDGAPSPSAGRSCCWPPSTTSCSSGVEHPLAALLRHGPGLAVKPAGSDPAGRVDAIAGPERSHHASVCRVHRGELEELDRHPHHPDQRGRTLHCAAARPLPHRLAATAAECRSRCSTSARRPGSTCSSTTTPTPTGAARGGATRTAGKPGSGVQLGLRSPRRRAPTCPSWVSPPWPSGSASTSRRSTPSPTTRHAGCWPASGPTTRCASAACAPPSTTCGPRRTRRAWTQGDMVARPGVGGGTRSPATSRSSSSTPGWPPTSTRRSSEPSSTRCARSGAGRARAPPLLRDPLRDARPPDPAVARAARGARSRHHAGPHRPGRRPRPPGRHPSARLLDPLVARCPRRLGRGLDPGAPRRVAPGRHLHPVLGDHGPPTRPRCARSGCGWHRPRPSRPCQDCSRAMALSLASSRPSPRSKESWSAPPALSPDALDPEQAGCPRRVDARQQRRRHLPDGAARGDGSLMRVRARLQREVLELDLDRDGAGRARRAAQHGGHRFGHAQHVALELVPGRRGPG